MEEENQYYVPRLIDIRAGYKCEFSLDSFIDEEGNMKQYFLPYIIGNDKDTATFSFIKESIERGAVRTKFLIIEDIVELGWEDEGQIIPTENITLDRPINLRRLTKGRYWMIYDFIPRVVMIAITMGDIHSVCVQRYDCPSVNELIYILSALNLH